MDYCGLSKNGDEYYADDLDVYMWRSWMREPKFRDMFEQIVEARMISKKIGMYKTPKGYKWQTKSK